MKVLHIGKEGMMEKFSSPDSLLYESKTADLPMGLAAEEYIRAAGDAEHLIADAIAPVTAELIEGLPLLKSIHSEGVAFNRIDTEAASARGVSVCHSAGMNAGAVAEQAILLMSGMLRNVINNDCAVREGRQMPVKEGYMKRGDLRELADCTVGLVGFGGSGKAVARLLQAYGVKKILVTRRSSLPEEEARAYGVTQGSLDELLSEADIVSLHLPASPETARMANKDFFGKMKQGSYFVNTARGELVDNEALVEALRSGKLAMAGLDTLDHEPVGKNHYLLQQTDIAERLILSPHIAGITAASFRRSYAMIWEDVAAVRAGKIPARCVNLK